MECLQYDAKTAKMVHLNLMNHAAWNALRKRGHTDQQCPENSTQLQRRMPGKKQGKAMPSFVGNSWFLMFCNEEHEASYLFYISRVAAEEGSSRPHAFIVLSLH